MEEASLRLLKGLLESIRIKNIDSMKEKRARVIAFYLPQFHPTPENDKYWGKGFTEWTNVAKAKPLFKGHIQPRIPADLGFYDLRLPIIREQQAQLAQEAGIEGFMYWHYWFGNGKMLLEKPFEEVLRSGKPDYPFCLGWANHDWSTKTWKDQNGNSMGMKTIAKQLYPGKEDYSQHFYYCLKAFKDKRYLKVDNKPIFLIYDPLAIPDISDFINIWNTLAKENGLEGIHFVGNCRGRDITPNMILKLGFDAVTTNRMYKAESEVVGSTWRRRLLSLLGWKLGGISLMKFDYEKVMKHMNDPEDYNENYYPTILPGYDRTPRAGRAAIIYSNPNPNAFRSHVRDVLQYVKEKDQNHKIIFLKSWNEWGEGNYMEPDITYGHQFLDALRDEILISH